MDKLRFFEIVTPLFVRGKFLRVTMCNLIVCAFQNWKISHAWSFGGDNLKNPTLWPFI